MKIDIEEYVSHVPQTEKEVVEALRKQVKTHMPLSNEIFSHGALGYGPTDSSFDRIIYIAVQKGYVNFGFFYGTHLPDPNHVLIGEGKRMRHIKIKNVKEAKDKAISLLLVHAWEDGIISVAKRHGKRKALIT